MATGTYPQFLAHENHKIAHKNAQKSFINFKPRIGNVAITGTNSPPPTPRKRNMTSCVIGRVRFERDCGKMYNRHLLPHGGLTNKSAPIPPQIRYLVDRNLHSPITLAFPQSDRYLLCIFIHEIKTKGYDVMGVNALNCTLCLMIFHFKKVVDSVRYIPLLQK